LNEGKPGPGSDSVVWYDPDHWGGPQSPPDTTLLHEVTHARNAAVGRDMADHGFQDPATKERWTNREEYQTIKGVENPYREERGLEQRTGHDDTP